MANDIKQADTVEPAPKTKPSAQERVAIEELAKRSKMAPTTLLFVRAAMQWPIGYAVTPKDFAEAVDRALNSPIR